MKIRIVSIIFIMAVISGMSQKDTLNKVDANNMKQGYWKIYDEASKALLEEGKYVNSQKEGIWKAYYETGKIKEEQYFQMGIREKTWRKYNEEGVAVLLIAYKNDTEISINGIKIKLPESETKLIK